ncbi:MAG: glycosyltransferase family 39 protein [Anaerolineales bacterium]
MQRLQKFFLRSAAQALLPALTALLGGVLFLARAWAIAHTFPPDLDEASYLLKGYLFASGVYEPFQPYGFWVNKMPLSFLIWGWVERLFGPGLRTGRYFAILLGALVALGVWLVARRFGGRWLAAASVWLLVLNPALLSLYGAAASQILVACLLTWALVLSLGERRPAWQIALGSALAGAMVLTRENMVFVLPLLLLYVFWEHGWKKGLISLASMVVVVGVGHWLYWPEILRLWATWLPFPLPAGLYASPSAAPASEAVASAASAAAAESQPLVTRLHSLSVGLRIYFIPLVGGLMVLLLWPKRNAWPSQAHFRAGVFLALTFFVLTLAHAWASLMQDYCIYCFSPYLAFFSNVGLLLVIVSLSGWNRRPAWLSQGAVVLGLLAAWAAVFFSLFEQIGAALLRLPVPRLREGRVLAGGATLWDILANKFHVEYEAARMYTPPVIGLLIGVLLTLVLFVAYRRSARWRNSGRFGYFVVCAFLALGFASTPVVNALPPSLVCSADVLRSYERLGELLATVAPPGTPVYIDGRVAAMPLLYAPGVVLLPPQVNDRYNYQVGGDPDRLLRDGYWNEAIALQWREQAEVFVIAENRYHDWNDEYIAPQHLVQLQVPLEVYACPAEDRLYLFYRK